MKKIELKKFVIEGDNKPTTYADLIKIIAKTGGEKGLDAEEMDTRSRIFSALRKATETTMELEDADFELLKALVVKHHFGMYDDGFHDFIQYFKELK